jgi:hypothetical protein
MKVSTSCEAASCAVTQELTKNLWNPKVHYRFHKSPPLVPTLNQISPVYTTSFCLCKIHFNIIHPPTCLVFLVVTFLLAFHQYPV